MLMSDSLEPPESCRYCRDLKPGYTTNTYIPFDEWAPGICISSCQTCRVIVQGIKELCPGFLEGEFDGQAAGPRPGEDVWLSVDERCRVVIGILKNGVGHRVVDIQFYYPLTNGGECAVCYKFRCSSSSQRPDTSSVVSHSLLLDQTHVKQVIFATGIYSSAIKTTLAYIFEDGVSARVPQIGYAGEISPVPGDKPMWTFLRKCLDYCIKEHDKCKASQDPHWYPERLLYLTQRKAGKDALQLVQTTHHIPMSRYIALSHCWGSKSPLRTSKKNLSQFLEDISISDLPMTFRDCLTAARELGVHYIWIDSLCIVQDDRQDWARHARSMDKIYENALFTVAAVCSPNGQVPFLGPHAPSNRETWQAVNINIDAENVEPPKKANGLPQAQLKARKYEPYLFPDFFHGPLESRGWAWQERYLSVRIINFTKEEVRWHCKVSKTCECIGAVQPPDPQPQQRQESQADDSDSLSIIQQWRSIVTAYSQRGLTYTTDRLPALSGAASRFSTSLQSEYLGGMWLSDFPRALAWYRRELTNCSTGKPKMWRSLDNGVPSWSWASIHGQTYWMWDFDFEPPAFKDVPIESRVELIDYKYRKATDNAFGEVEKGSYIELKGMVVEAEMESDIHGGACVRRHGFGPQHIVPDCHVISVRECSLLQGSRKVTRRAIPTDKLAKSLTDGQRSTGQVCCLLLFTITKNECSHACVLILGKQLDGTYQRLGIGSSDPGYSRPLYKQCKSWEVWENWVELEEWEEWEAWFSDAETRAMKIQ